MTPMAVLGLLLLGLLLFFVSIIGWKLFLGPLRKVARILSRPPHTDRKIPQFVDLDPSWTTYRILPQPGWRTVWKIQTSENKPIGRIEIGGFQKGIKRGANPIYIGQQEFWIRRNMVNLLQDGFLIQSHNLELKLVTDKLDLVNTIKTNFRNLKIESKYGSYTVQADHNKRIVLAKNGTKIGIATYRLGTFPGFAAMASNVSELEQTILFYSMLTM